MVQESDGRITLPRQRHSCDARHQRPSPMIAVTFSHLGLETARTGEWDADHHVACRPGMALQPSRWRRR